MTERRWVVGVEEEEEEEEEGVTTEPEREHRSEPFGGWEARRVGMRMSNFQEASNNTTPLRENIEGGVGDGVTIKITPSQLSPYS